MGIRARCFWCHEGVISSWASCSPTVIVLAVPLVIAAIPIADTAAAIIRRLYHHQPIQQADRKHLHHMLLRKGYGVRKSVVIVYAWTALLGVGAWVMSNSHGIAVWAMIAIMLVGRSSSVASRRVSNHCVTTTTPPPARRQAPLVLQRAQAVGDGEKCQICALRWTALYVPWNNSPC
ncbi:MAG: hypothetical protein ACLSDQ_04335 [Adlercreutzia equolifaciens]